MYSVAPQYKFASHSQLCMQSARLCAFDDLFEVTMRPLHKMYCVAVTTILLQFLASCSAARVEDVGMPPGTTLGDHACIHDKVNTPGYYGFRCACMYTSR